MQISGQESAENPKETRKTMEKSFSSTFSSEIEIEECTPMEQTIKRERRQSVELAYSDVVPSIPEESIHLSSPKKGTCVVQTRCTEYVKLCLCEVKRHKSLTSCWLVSKGIVYDVTNVIQQHPAGTKCILRKAGGPDCTQDLRFHSNDAQKCWKQCAVGKMLPCGEDPAPETGASCSIM